MAKNGKTIERGRYTQTRRALKAFEGFRLDVGYFAGQKGSGNSKFLMPEIAAVQEFGSHPRKRFNRVPERSFMRTTFDKFRRVYSLGLAREGFRAALGRQTPQRALLKVGEDYRSDVVNKITGIRSPRNAPRTIAGKGFDNPLIHTGLMRASIKTRVLRKGGGL